jgi:hypothetical protein
MMCQTRFTRAPLRFIQPMPNYVRARRVVEIASDWLELKPK